jgi:uncharacterized protein YdeI (YjbR/CyaY-like superfamily)
MSALDDAPHFHADDRSTWRAWLEANHRTARGAWLVTWRRRTGRVDDERGKLYFAPRKPRSVWAASNRARVERLIEEGRMAPAGLAAIERAKANGSWTVLEAAERMEIPDDLTAAFEGRPPAAANFAAFPPSARRMLLAWVAVARRPETRAARIAEIAEAAARNERARS